ncbi:MAG: aldehyde:ferredoxin oxidoreductase [Bacteroidetes bacterium GWA2_31_9b]|nr:MAG: aldehyde:ferredoxin oxidoreductase [Bacteroidetes bacterium GWA2_31_9b]
MSIKGYYGRLLDINLTTGEIKKTQIPEEDIKHFIGGRGLGTKLLWDKLPNPGIDPLSPENAILYMPGPFSGLPIPSSSRTCVVTKSPRTSALNSKYEYGSTVSYSNMGGFFGPEIRFAGYDGICVIGKASKPVYIKIIDDEVEICDASKFWGMGTDEFDNALIEELGDRKFESCYIGPAGENLVPMASILNTAARAAGRGGTGCVMGSKNLKAIAVKGTQMPKLGDHKKYLELLEKVRTSFKEENKDDLEWWRYGGTANALTASSKSGTQAVKNYSEGTFGEIEKIGAAANREQVWKRDFACFSCQLACKKSGIAKGSYSVMVHDGPEYETGTLFGANLLISDLAGLQKLIAVADDYGIDIISAGNVIGFLMEAYEKGIIDSKFLEGIELTWGNVEGSLELLQKMCNRQGIGDLACRGVKYLAEEIKQDSSKFAIHVKGHELAAWNVPVNSEYWSICYATSNRGACHMNGGSPERQDMATLRDSLAACSFASGWYKNEISYSKFLTAITGLDWTDEEFAKAGTRIFTLEKMFNYREGFIREDDNLPYKFFENKFTFGDFKGSIVDKKEFEKNLTEYYKLRGWDTETSKPSDDVLNELDLEFTIM